MALAKAAAPKAPRAPTERARSATLIVNGNAVERPPPPDLPPQDVPRPDRSGRDPQALTLGLALALTLAVALAVAPVLTLALARILA